MGKKKKIDWNNYLHRNRRDEMDCQLVTICNAYTYLTGKKVNQDSKAYTKLLQKCGCVAGACTDTSAALKHFGIEVEEVYKSYELDELLSKNKFFEISVWHKHYGFHSVACVDYNKECKALKITNFKYATSLGGWIFIEDLNPHVCDNPNREGWAFRTFKLKEKNNVIRKRKKILS